MTSHTAVVTHSRFFRLPIDQGGENEILRDIAREALGNCGRGSCQGNNRQLSDVTEADEADPDDLDRDSDNSGEDSDTDTPDQDLDATDRPDID